MSLERACRTTNFVLSCSGIESRTFQRANGKYKDHLVGQLTRQKTTLSPFLAVQNSSIGDLVTHWVTHWLSHSLTDFYFCHTKSNPRDLLPLRHLIRVLRRHDLTERDLPNFKNLKNFQKNWKFPDFLKISRNFENFKKI